MRLQLKRPWSDGTYALEMDALALLSRLAASVPPPRQHVVVYAGVLASNSRWRPLVIPPPADQSTAATDNATTPQEAAPRPAPQKPSRSGTRCRYLRWADLMRLTFGLTVDQCPACGGRMKLRALVHDKDSIERFLRHQGLWSPPPEPTAARAPPYQRSVTRLHPCRQEELSFDT